MSTTQPTIQNLQDPPLPSRAQTVIRMSSEEARRHTIQVLVAGICFAAACWWLWRHSFTFWAVIAGLIAVVLLPSAFGKKSLVAPCPFCTTGINGISEKDNNRTVRCNNCFEYSVVSNLKVSPLDPNTSFDTPKFQSPVFEGAVCPAGC